MIKVYEFPKSMRTWPSQCRFMEVDAPAVGVGEVPEPMRSQVCRELMRSDYRLARQLGMERVQARAFAVGMAASDGCTVHGARLFDSEDAR